MSTLTTFSHVSEAFWVIAKPDNYNGHPSELLKGYSVAKSLAGRGLKILLVNGENIDELYAICTPCVILSTTMGHLPLFVSERWLLDSRISKDPTKPMMPLRFEHSTPMSVFIHQQSSQQYHACHIHLQARFLYSSLSSLISAKRRRIAYLSTTGQMKIPRDSPFPFS